MTHFVMTCEGEPPIAAIRGAPRLPGGAWNKGRKLELKVPEPLTYSLKPGAPGNLKALYSGLTVPLIRLDLLEALQAAGVDNLELYRAEIVDGAGRRSIEHRAFNVVGLVEAADMGRSVLMKSSSSSLIDVDFDELTLDESRAAHHLMFRLAEKVSAIVVDQSVREEIERRRIPGMVFYGPGEWSG